MRYRIAKTPLLYLTIAAWALAGASPCRAEIGVRFFHSDSVYWDGSIWMLAETRSDDKNYRIYSLEPGGRGKPEWTGKTVPRSVTRRPLPGGDRLWFMGPGSAAFLKDGKLTQSKIEGDTRFIYPEYFLLDGKPAALEGDGRYRTYTLSGNTWEKTAEFEITSDGKNRIHHGNLKIFPAGGVYHLFIAHERAIYHRAGIPEGKTSLRSGGWKRAADRRADRAVSAAEGAPVVYHISGDWRQKQLHRYTLKNGKWKQLPDAVLPLFSSDRLFAAHNTGGADDFVILNRAFPGRTYAALFKDGKKVSEKRFGNISGIYFTFISMAVLCALIFLNMALSAKAPFWYVAGQITEHKESRKYDAKAFNADELLSYELRPNPYLTIKPYRDKKALVVNDTAIMYIEKGHSDITVRFVTKISNMYALITAFCVSLGIGFLVFDFSFGRDTSILFSIVFFLIGVFGFFPFFRKTSVGSSKFFKILLMLLDIEKDFKLRELL